MERSLSSIFDSLRAQREKLKAQRESALHTVGTLESELLKIQRAIAALLGEQPPKRRSPRGRGVNGEQIRAIVEEILRAEGPLTEPLLKERVDDKAASDGYRKLGVQLVMLSSVRAVLARRVAQDPTRCNSAGRMRTMWNRCSVEPTAQARAKTKSRSVERNIVERISV